MYSDNKEGVSTNKIDLSGPDYSGLRDDPAVFKAMREEAERRENEVRREIEEAERRENEVRREIEEARQGELERSLSLFYITEETLVYSSRFDALFAGCAALLGGNDLLVMDELNSLLLREAARGTKAREAVYAHADMVELERILREAGKGPDRILICSDGVFDGDGDIAKLDTICGLAERHGAEVLVDETLAAGYLGPGARGSAAYHGVEDSVSLLCTGFGAAFGGMPGASLSGKGALVSEIAGKYPPEFFSTSLSSVETAGIHKALELVRDNRLLRIKVMENTAYFKLSMRELGFDIVRGETAIVPILCPNENDASACASELEKQGIIVATAEGEARLWVHISARYSREEYNRVLRAFGKVGKRAGCI